MTCLETVLKRKHSSLFFLGFGDEVLKRKTPDEAGLSTWLDDRILLILGHAEIFVYNKIHFKFANLLPRERG
jgi:hypothetical protein